MTHESHPLSRRTLALGLPTLGLAPMTWGQSPQLYDPQPPADSAYVRVIVARHNDPVELLVDQKSRFKGLIAGQPSDYLVLTAGSHRLMVKSDKQSAGLPLEVVAGRALTVVWPTLGANATPQVIEDKLNTNKLKAVITAYHLGGTGPVDILTADGNTPVFNALAPGASASLVVNPISLDLMAAPSGSKTSPIKVALAMSQGGAYSLLVSAGHDKVLQFQAYTNKVERYTGK